MKRIIKHTKESIYEMFEDKIVKILISVIVYIASSQVYKEQIGINTKPEEIILFSIFVIISWYFLLVLYEIKPHKYASYIKKLSIIVDYAGDDITIRKDYSVRINRLYANKIYMRSTWFSNEKFDIQCTSKGYKIEYINKLGNDIEYYVVFPKRKYFWNKVEFSMVSHGVNSKRQFKNFYWYDVIAPTKNLSIDVRIPSKYCENVVELQSFREYKDSRTYCSDTVEYDGCYLWKIPKPKLKYSYVVEWKWSKQEKKAIQEAGKIYRNKS